MSRDWTEQIYGDMESINIDDIIKEKEKQIESLQEQLHEANRIIEGLRPFIQGSNDRQTFMKILHYEERWGVK